MLPIVLVCSLSVLAATGQQVEDDWIDPYDMINYDASTKTMRKPTEPANYPNVPTKRREYTQDSNRQTPCDRQLVDLQKQIEELNKKIKLISQQPTCSPVFKRFLSRLLKEIQRVGLSSDSTDNLYDAKIILSRQAMTEIQMLLEGEDSWRTGALDNAISQILVDVRPHNYEAWKWRFEDTFGVDIDTLLKIGLFVLIIVAIISTQMWSTVSWFMQFSRLFAVCFFVSIIWNWFYLYKIAFAEHQNNMAKMDNEFNAKCTGIKKIDWSDSLKEWFRSTWTLQDDPCKRYYEVLMVNPILLVPPTKAISVTITTFITEPLKHIGQGISEFLRALLKDLPVTLQIPVLLTIVLAIVVSMYGGVQAAFQHGIAAPFRRPRMDPPLPEPQQQQQPQRYLRGVEDHDPSAQGDAPQNQPRDRADDVRLERNQVHQRRPNRTRKEPARMNVEIVRSGEAPYSEDETDAQQRQTEEEPAGASAGSVDADTTQSETKPSESVSSQTQTKLRKENEKHSKDELSREGAASKSQPAERQSSQRDVQDMQASPENITASISLTGEESFKVPVQESSRISAESTASAPL